MGLVPRKVGRRAARQKFKKIGANQGVDKQVWFVLSTVGGSGGGKTPGKLCNGYPHLSLETVLKLTQNCYINMNIFFLENWRFNHKLAPPLSPTNIVRLKD